MLTGFPEATGWTLKRAQRSDAINHPDTAQQILNPAESSLPPPPPCLPGENESVDFLSVIQPAANINMASIIETPRSQASAGFPTNEPPNLARNAFYLNKDYATIWGKYVFQGLVNI